MAINERESRGVRRPAFYFDLKPLMFWDVGAHGANCFAVATKDMRPSFYTYFSSAYGTIWLVLFVIGFLSRTNIQTGCIGVFGFPIVALIYAVVRRRLDSAKSPDRNSLPS